MRLSMPAVHLRRPALRRWIAPAIAGALLLSGGTMMAKAATPGKAAAAPGRAAAAAAMTPDMAGMTPDMAGMTPGRGPNEFGMTFGDLRGTGSRFTYTHGYFCDRTVTALSATGCEVGAAATRLPPGARRSDTLFIAVPLGFNVKMLHCPANLTCVDHPMTVDMTRITAALAPIFKTSPAQLQPMLANFPTPSHDHFVTTRNGGRAEWWDVKVIGVTDPRVYQAIQQHQSLAFIQALLAAKNPHVVGPIPTNIFLFFAVA